MNAEYIGAKSIAAVEFAQVPGVVLTLLPPSVSDVPPLPLPLPPPVLPLPPPDELEHATTTAAKPMAPADRPIINARRFANCFIVTPTFGKGMSVNLTQEARSINRVGPRDLK
jgi:hypothetical protein